MLSEEKNRFISDIVYELDYLKRSKYKLKEGDVKYYSDLKPSLGQYKVLKIEDNKENGMQAMAVVPIGADGQPDYSQITITYAGTNFWDYKDRDTDIQMIGFGNTKYLSLQTGQYTYRIVESQAAAALRFAAEVRK